MGLGIEISRIWYLKKITLPVVIGALGMISFQKMQTNNVALILDNLKA